MAIFANCSIFYSSILPLSLFLMNFTLSRRTLVSVFLISGHILFLGENHSHSESEYRTQMKDNNTMHPMQKKKKKSGDVLMYCFNLCWKNISLLAQDTREIEWVQHGICQKQDISILVWYHYRFWLKEDDFQCETQNKTGTTSNQSKHTNKFRVPRKKRLGLRWYNFCRSSREVENSFRALF